MKINLFKRHQGALKIHRQHGMTLMEAVAYLGLFGLVVGGALALNSGASSAQSSIQHTSEIQALKQATQQVYFGQGGYGSASLNSALVTAKKVPGSLSVSGSTITNRWGGTVTITGATSTFTIASTQVDQPTCVQMEAQAIQNGWTSIQIGAGTVRTAAVPVATATTDCSTNSNTMTFTN